MKIGILHADDLAQEIINEFGDYADMFKNILSPVDEALSFHKYQVTQSEYPKDINECDAYLLTGSKYSAYDNEAWIRQLIKFIIELHQQKKKLTGICFGHQLIATALGGLTKKSEKGWGLGVMTSDVVGINNQEIQNWLRPEANNFSIMVSHQDQVVKLPPRAELIAGNTFCPNAGFQIGESVLTFQGHPEFNAEYLKYIMNKRRELAGEETYLRAQSSLKQPHDQKLVAQWLVNFLNNN
jgi:GMP synthase-like glutamine amidotransferase